MPLPIRRSCANCVKSKRKCSLDVPLCKRCAERGLTCSYQNEPPSPATAAVFGAMPSNGVSTHDGNAANVAMLVTPESNNFDGHNLDFNPSFALGNEMNWYADATMYADVDDVIMPSSLAKEIEEDNSIMSGQAYMPRVYYAAALLKKWPAGFAQRRTNPFIHKELLSVKTSEMILDALSACALYSTKNAENQTFVFEVIRRKAKALVDRQDIPFATPSELLVTTRCLVLYQIMRLLDGDIRSRAEAEADALVQVRWTVELLKHFKPLKTALMDPLFGIESQIENSNWMFWVFDESVRRTILTSYMLQGVYSFMRHGMDPVCGKVEKLSFTGQAELWEAPSEYHWRKTWDQKPRFELRVSQWSTDAAGMSVEQSKELGLLMTALMDDVDGTAEWVGEDNLQMCGLDWESVKKYKAYA
ncbi:hypothetical protein NA57DRAFT_48841 [Rhizodiscina lignyota]|uniref:Zn(2)-C6 fungal-type domain-containing protein n=1 Tax=Rhizodiscina lignyota TaxID=1504668 RepID=A0A9P4I6C8_9PEZI|nr:hypothetical protein NA57DRAFT_48841 [Rhizodiscina lignyota]